MPLPAHAAQIDGEQRLRQLPRRGRRAQRGLRAILRAMPRDQFIQKNPRRGWWCILRALIRPDEEPDDDKREPLA